MKQIKFDNPFFKKKLYNIDINQIECIENLYLKGETTPDITNVLKQKFNAYKSQDKKSHKFDIEQHITYEEMIEKLYLSKLKCYYCLCDINILYNLKRQKNQWTLERLNNNLGHYASNTCICCLSCNLKRRTENHEYFKKSKQTVIIKLEL